MKHVTPLSYLLYRLNAIGHFNKPVPAMNTPELDAFADHARARNLGPLLERARVYSKSCPSPHHMVFTLEGLNNLVNDALEQEREDQAQKLYTLENIRLLASRFRTQDWAKTVLRFCDAANVKPHTLRNVEVEKAPEANPMVSVLTEGVFNGKFKPGDLVRKVKGSKWQGKIVGWYSTDLTKVGWAVESSTETGSVQIYPESALELVAAKADVSKPLPFKATSWLNIDNCSPALGRRVWITDAAFNRTLEATVIPSTTPGATAFKHKVDGLDSIIAKYWRYDESSEPTEPTKLVDEDVALVLEAWDFSQFDRENLKAVPTNVFKSLHNVFEKLSNASLLVAPTVGAKFEICLPSGIDKHPGLVGVRTVNVKRIEREDDDSITVVIDYWPEDTGAESIARQRTLIDRLEAQLAERTPAAPNDYDHMALAKAMSRIAELEQALNSAHANIIPPADPYKNQAKYVTPWLGSYWYVNPPKKP